MNDIFSLNLYGHICENVLIKSHVLKNTHVDTTFHIQLDQPECLQEGQPIDESNYEQPMKEATLPVEEEATRNEQYTGTQVRRPLDGLKIMSCSEIDRALYLLGGVSHVHDTNPTMFIPMRFLHRFSFVFLIHNSK